MVPETITDPPDIQQPRPVLFGEVLFDCFGEREVPGGAPLNAAWHLQALGWNPLLISRIGDDDQGRRIIKRMQDWGMDTAGIQHDQSHPTGRVEVKMDSDTHSFHILENQAYDFIVAEDACRAAERQQTGILYHGSLALRAASGESLRRLSDEVDAPIFLDINLRAPWWRKDAVLEMIRRATHLKLNDEELALLCPASMKNAAPERAAAEMCTDWKLETLWLTLGAEGAFYCSAAGDRLRIPPVEDNLSIVDTVGAGDAFSAALLGGFLKGSEPRETAACAAALAARVCGKRGATAMESELDKGLEAITNNRNS